MRLTEKKLKEIVKEVLEGLNLGGRLPRKDKTKRQKPSSPTTKGSKEKPCPPTSFGPGVGKKLFDPQNPSAISAGEWECNTQLEDDILITLQKFVSRNEWLADDPLTRRILSNLKKAGDETPVRPLPPNVKIYRGASLNWQKRPTECLRIMNSLNFSNMGKEYYGYYRVPSSGYAYKPFRGSTSFSDDLDSAYEFAAASYGIIYETDSSVISENSIILEYNPSFYNLVDNPDYQIKQGGYHKGEKFNSVKRFEVEKETLYVGKDPIPMQFIWVDPEEIILSLRRLLKPFKDPINAPEIYVHSYNNLLKAFKAQKVLSPRSMRYLPFGARKFKKK